MADAQDLDITHPHASANVGDVENTTVTRVLTVAGGVLAAWIPVLYLRLDAQRVPDRGEGGQHRVDRERVEAHQRRHQQHELDEAGAVLCRRVAACGRADLLRRVQDHFRWCEEKRRASLRA